jgi:hypothetical protein
VFQLVYGDRDLTLPLHFRAAVEDHLARLVALEETEGDAGHHSRLAALLVDAISRVVDPDCGEPLPTDKQLKYALAVARELGISLPPEVLTGQKAMSVFLNAHAATFRKIRQLRRSA